MFRFIYRQRRRIFFSTFLVVLSVHLRMTDLGADAFPAYSVEWFTIALVYVISALGFVAICMLWLWVLPNWRFMIEQAAVMLFIFSAFSVIWPNYEDSFGIGPFLPVMTFFAVLVVAHGQALDRFPISLGARSKRRYQSKRSPEELWPLLVPTPQNAKTHWDSLLHEITPDPDDPNIQDVAYHHGASIYQKQRQTFTELAAPHRASYQFDGAVTSANKAITGGTYTVDLDPRPSGGTTVTLTENYIALLPRVALTMWFDDALGDVTDCLRTKERGGGDWTLSGRYRRKALSLS